MASSLKAARRGARSTLGRAGLIVSALAVVAALVSGCAYRFGNGTLYPPEIRTVHVPMFDSVSLRRGLGERLTEAVVRDIELKTPFKVVDSVGADSTLTGASRRNTRGRCSSPPRRNRAASTSRTASRSCGPTAGHSAAIALDSAPHIDRDGRSTIVLDS